jgi:hypothetical protein
VTNFKWLPGGGVKIVRGAQDFMLTAAEVAGLQTRPTEDAPAADKQLTYERLRYIIDRTTEETHPRVEAREIVAMAGELIQWRAEGAYSCCCVGASCDCFTDRDPEWRRMNREAK